MKRANIYIVLYALVIDGLRGGTCPDELQRGFYYGCEEGRCILIEVVSPETMNIEVYKGEDEEVFYGFPDVGYTLTNCRLEIERVAPFGFRYLIDSHKFEDLHEIIIGSAGLVLDDGAIVVSSDLVGGGSVVLDYRGPEKKNWNFFMFHVANQSKRILTMESARSFMTRMKQFLVEYGAPATVGPPCGEGISRGFYLGCEDEGSSCWQIEVVSDERMNIESSYLGSLYFSPDVEYLINPDTCVIEFSTSRKSVKIDLVTGKTEKVVGGVNKLAGRYEDSGPWFETWDKWIFLVGDQGEVELERHDVAVSWRGVVKNWLGLQVSTESTRILARPLKEYFLEQYHD